MAIAGFHEFTDREQLAETLAKTVAEKLAPDVEFGQFASCALSGGSTPKLFLEKLSNQLGSTAEMIYFAPVDERCVPASDERSNERMIKERLGLSQHPASEFLSLFHADLSMEESIEKTQQQLLEDDELPFTVMTLGMGLDGHTASLFPGADRLDNAVDMENGGLFEVIEAPGAQEPRVTMTLPLIVSSQYLILHIEGDDKRRVFDEAMKDGPANDMPVRHVLRHKNANLHVYWAP